MIDVGATECVPCKMMAPIMAELEKEYEGIADIAGHRKKPLLGWSAKRPRI